MSRLTEKSKQFKIASLFLNIFIQHFKTLFGSLPNGNFEFPQTLSI